MARRRLAFILGGLACAAALIVGAYVAGAHKARHDVHASAERQLQIMALDLESVLEKFETLPFTLAYHPDVPLALARHGDGELIRRLNLTLQSIQRQAKVSAIYLMDREGTTLASSNWDQPLSFVDRNFAFRPYFKEAIAGRAGRFYGIGSATSEPGYFIAKPVRLPGAAPEAAPAGVIAVKISLAEFEQTWHSSEEPVALADASGVVFLSNRPDWRYHSLVGLDVQARRGLAATLQYAAMDIAPIASLPVAAREGFGDHVGRPVGRLGWQLMLYPSEARIRRSAALAAAAAALLLTVAGMSSWALYLRRRRQEERLASREALQRAAEDLDRKIAQSTRELLEANRTLETKYAKLQETEQLLRTTQNELVQAGKLAMLGQMAAGITHELNQPLAAIRAFADNAVTFLKRGQDDRAGENLAQISAASARMGSIIGQLKGFARKSHDTVSTVDLAQAVRASVRLLESELRRSGTSLETDIREAVRIIGDPVRTEQVLINLIRNAIDAVEPAAVRRIEVILERSGAEAVIRIRDSGAGIPAQVAPHLFEPFFTTKVSDKGLGLGLAISSSIVQAMDGALTARNHPGGGAEFEVRLPAATDVCTAEERGAASA